MQKPYNTFILYLKYFTTNEDRHIKGHAMALLNKLQQLNPQDDILMCEDCHIKEKLPLWKVCNDCINKITQ